ncbi:MAG: hypothetical protein ACTS8S_01325 [Giesbergeria sp.]
MLPRILLVSVIVTLIVWLGWSILTPIDLHLAMRALVNWGLTISVGMALLLIVAWTICRWLRLAPLIYPFLSGFLAIAPTMVLDLSARVLLPSYAVVAFVVGAALLSMPRLRH